MMNEKGEEDGCFWRSNVLLMRMRKNIFPLCTLRQERKMFPFEESRCGLCVMT